MTVRSGRWPVRLALHVITNRARFGRDGTFSRPAATTGGGCAYGSEASPSGGLVPGRAAGLLQLRLPWDLLNVTDPSTRTLLFDAAHQR